MANAIITLTTDYGTNDHLVGTLKGVILKINPDVTIVDITHNVTPFDLLDGAHKYSVWGRNGTQYGCNGGRPGVYCVQWSEQSGCRGACPLTPFLAAMRLPRRTPCPELPL